MTKTINTKQLAHDLDMDISKLRRKINAGEIQTLNRGKKAIITPTAVEHFHFTNDYMKTLSSMKTKSKVISFVNHKGGCSKTTTAYTTAALLQSFGNKVLLIDLDPQGNATESILEPVLDDEGIPQTFPSTIRDLLIDKHLNENVGVNRIKEVIRPGRYGFDCIPCDLTFNTIAADLSTSQYKEVILKDLISEISGEYDYIILDTPPTASFSVNSALTASDYIVIVSLAEAYSVIGVNQTINLIDSARKQNSVLVDSRKMNVLGIVISKAEMKTNISKHHVEQLQEVADEKNILLYVDDIIPKTTKLPETQALYKIITEYDPKGEASIAYFNIALQIDMKIKKDKIKEKL